MKPTKMVKAPAMKTMKAAAKAAAPAKAAPAKAAKGKALAKPSKGK